MPVGVGIALACVAMLCWGIGDFWIQRSTRKIGNIEALFFITAFGAVVLFPFVYKNIPQLLNAPGSALVILGTLCVVLLFAALLDFEALRVGKLSVVEPIWSFEVPVAALLAFFILGERVTGVQIGLIVALLFGLLLVSMRDRFRFGAFLLERGTLLAFFGAVLMGAANFFMGWGSRVSDPIMANFIADAFIALVTGGILLYNGKFTQTILDCVRNKGVLLQMSIADKVAWLAFAFAMVLAPIGVVVALSESYIIIAVFLGLSVGKERLSFHQKAGLVIALAAAIWLAVITV